MTQPHLFVQLTPEILREIIPNAGTRAAIFADSISDACNRYSINTPKRLAAFLAQVAHESGSLLYVKELASGKAYDTGKLAATLGNTPEADGDGQKYKGRGLIQITGTANYRACSFGLFGDDRLLRTPELLEQPENAALSAAWFWDSRKLNILADAGDFRKITKRINGGYNGWEDRLQFYTRAKKILYSEDNKNG